MSGNIHEKKTELNPRGATSVFKLHIHVGNRSCPTLRDVPAFLEQLAKEIRRAPKETSGVVRDQYNRGIGLWAVTNDPPVERVPLLDGDG